MSAGGFDNASCLEPPLYKTMNNHPHSLIQKQGILIHSSDFVDSPPKNNNIRRALSAADMSSQKWLQSTSLKRVQSSLQMQAHNDDNNNNRAFEDVWSTIQADNNTWGSILSPPNTDGSGSQAPPYVHPLAKRTASSLSGKSLEICTESLGSETGSDGFSYPPSEPDDSDKEHGQDQDQEVEAEVISNNYKCSSMKRSMMVPCVRARPLFPPPLPSLAHRDNGSNLHIRSHRQDGRLVVEAVSVPSPNCFRARRQDGRLLLTLSSSSSDDDGGVVEEEDNVVEDDPLGIRGVMNVQRSLTMSKLMRNNSTWPRNYNTTVIKTLNDDDVAEVIPTRPAALNAYEYYWRRSNSPAAGVAMLNPLVGQQNNNNNNNNRICAAQQVEKDAKKENGKNKSDVKKQEVVVVKGGGGEYLVPLLLRGCKDPKRSLLLWDAPCIATS